MPSTRKRQFGFAVLLTTALFLIALLLWPPSPAVAAYEGTWTLVEISSQTRAYLLNTSTGELWLIFGDKKQRVADAASTAEKAPPPR